MPPIRIHRARPVRFIRLLALSAIVSGLPACGPLLNLLPLNLASPAGTRSTIIIIRHCERDPGADPPLNAEGMARAEKLRDALAEHGVDAIYATDLIRNRQSVQPIADLLGITPILVNPALYADTTSTASLIVDEILRDHAGQTVLYCGNTGSTLGTPGINEELYHRLGGTGRPPTRYSDFFVIVVPDEGPNDIAAVTYGGQSSLDSAI